MSMFKKAVRAQRFGRLALEGPPGAGKTFTALLIAKHLCPPERDPTSWRIAVIDTERSSASLYAGEVADFDSAELGSHSPKSYREALTEAGREGFDVVIVDSLSHAWMGRDGALEQVDKRAAASKSKNSFEAWRHVTPEHNQLVDALLTVPAHLIVTMRTKVEYVVEKDEKTGKSAPRKVGTAPVQRDGVEYEFDVVAELDAENTLTVTKSRCSELAGKAITKPGRDVAEILRAWLAGAADAPPSTSVTSKADAVIAAYRAATDGDTYKAARAELERIWKGLTQAERDRTVTAQREAQERLKAAADARAAQQAAEAPSLSGDNDPSNEPGAGDAPDPSDQEIRDLFDQGRAAE